MTEKHQFKNIYAGGWEQQKILATAHLHLPTVACLHISAVGMCNYWLLVASNFYHDLVCAL